MVTKQIPGARAPDGGQYVTLTDGNGNLTNANTTVGSTLAVSASGTTGAVVATLAGAAGKTTYITGFDVSAVGGTAAIGPIVVAGLTSSFTYQLFSSASGSNLSIRYPTPVPASAVNTAITITTTADGTASAVNVNATGFQL